LLELSENLVDALVDDAIDRIERLIAEILAKEGADQATARLCAERAVDIGIHYGINDTQSLVGIGKLLGLYDAEFETAPSIVAALSNERAPPHERVGRILNSPALMNRIIANVPPGIDRRLRAEPGGQA
jgi:hypothetical protein